MPDYTTLTVIAVVAVVVIELAWLRTGIFASLQYWLTMAIVVAFQILVDGWLTKLSDPIVIYDPDTMLGVRAPWDIPIEDFGFGFAMVTLTVMLWRRAIAASGRTASNRAPGEKSHPGPTEADSAEGGPTDASRTEAT
ncbi:lycopene cyclase domain-containing protein [Microlunatus ginsengisoli]|uniref:Lycopene cyclase domain-containing protein n=1 Tax=Microlunatus ginsengisoli TaxID=363863 RepID=A0ABP6ZI12_9ACTN